MRIGLDIDDVLFPWSEHAHTACEAAGITNGAQITRWRFYEDYGCTADEFWDVVNAEYRAGMLDRDPYPGVTDLLASVREAGHTVHLVTARGFDGPLADMVRASTGAWALRHAPHDSLTFAKDKAAVAWDVFLDDSPTNVRALHGVGRRCFLRDQPHNRIDCDDLVRIDNLAAFINLATGLEVTP